MNAFAYYEEIMELPGLDEMKNVVRQWDEISRNLSNQEAGAPLLLPNLLWKTLPGAGKTHFLQLLGEYLQAAKLLDFYGDVKFFEFYLEHCPVGTHLSELSRLIADVRGAAGFRNEYRGLLALDITEWTNHFKEAHFIKIMEYLSSIDDRVCIIFVLEGASKDEATEAEQMLGAFFRLRSANFPYPDADALATYCAKRLLQYHMKLDKSALRLLTESITELMKSAYFDGYKTVNRLYQDIAFDLSSTPDIQRHPVTAQHMAPFEKESPFIAGLSKITKMRSIGFGGER